MAYLSPDKKNTYFDDGGVTEGLSSGQSSIISSGKSSINNKPTNTGYINFQKYSELNKPQAEKMAQSQANKLISQSKDIYNQAQYEANKYKSGLDINKVNQQQSLISNLKNNASNYNNQSTRQALLDIYNQNPNNIKSFTESDPYKNLYNKSKELTNTIQGTNTAFGRLQAIDNAGKTAGQQALNLGMLGLSPVASKYEDVRKNYNLNNQLLNEAEQANNLYNQYTTAQNNARAGLKGLYGDYQTFLNEANKAKEARMSQMIKDAQDRQNITQRIQDTQNVQNLAQGGINLRNLTEQIAGDQDIKDYINLQNEIENKKREIANYQLDKTGMNYNDKAQIRRFNKLASGQIENPEEKLLQDIQNLKSQSDILKNKLGEVGNVGYKDVMTPEKYAQFQALQDLLSGIYY